VNSSEQVMTMVRVVLNTENCLKQPKTANQKKKLLLLTSQTKLTENNRKVLGCFWCLEMPISEGWWLIWWSATFEFLEDRSLSKTLALIASLHYSVNKKLSCRYHRGTMQRTMLVNSCYVSQGMAVGKVSNSKSDLQGHSLPFDRPHTISYWCFIANMSVSCITHFQV